jgi:adenylylsulfate kinase-like enzyme
VRAPREETVTDTDNTDKNESMTKKKSKPEIAIIIAGKAAVGKTTIARAIERYLTRWGLDVEVEDADGSAVDSSEARMTAVLAGFGKQRRRVRIQTVTFAKRTRPKSVRIR